MPPSKRFGRTLFRIAGIEIAVHSSWLVIFGVLVLVARSEIAPRVVSEDSWWITPLSLGIALLFYAFVLVHELSHAVMARAHGLDARRITLFVFGGVAQIGTEARDPATEFRVAIAGPLASLMIAGILAAISMLVHPEFTATDGIEILPGIWGMLAVVNLALALFNLVPAFPLDGGRVLRAALWGGTRDRVRATRWAATLGKAFAFAMIGAGGAIAFVELGWGQSADAWQGVWYVVLGVFLFNVAGNAGQVEGGAVPRTGPPHAGRDAANRAADGTRDYPEDR